MDSIPQGATCAPTNHDISASSMQARRIMWDGLLRAAGLTFPPESVGVSLEYLSTLCTYLGTMHVSDLASLRGLDIAVPENIVWCREEVRSLLQPLADDDTHPLRSVALFAGSIKHPATPEHGVFGVRAQLGYLTDGVAHCLPIEFRVIPRWQHAHWSRAIAKHFAREFFPPLSPVSYVPLISAVGEVRR